MEDGDTEKYCVSSVIQNFCTFDLEKGLYQVYLIAGTVYSPIKNH